MVEEYHYLLCQFIEVRPVEFLRSPLAESTIQCALYCLSSSNELATASILRFLSELFELGIPEKSRLPADVPPLVTSLMRQHAPAFIQAFFVSIVVSFPRERGIISDVADILSIITKQLGTDATLQMMTAPLEKIPVAEMSTDLKQAFIIKLKP